ncbi:hypothetical protein HOG48_04405 [Candidatus Peregrinibacteria bacterium]|jgi:hypothetical protein|nr:hypothetical protein [Candidatus Peregrinibacteria bacterium]
MKKFIKKIGLLTVFFTLSGIQQLIVFAEDTAASTEATETGTTKISVELNEPIGDIAIIEADTAMGFITQYMHIMYKYGVSILGIVAVLVIAISGMQYALDSGSAEEAKKRILNSIRGLVLLFLSAFLLWFINPNFFQIN